MKRVLAFTIAILVIVSTFPMVHAQSGSLPRIGNWRPGDAHLHSSHSDDPQLWPDQIKSIGDIAVDALDFDLEWVIFTDHSYDMDAVEWEQARTECEQAETNTGIVVMCGEEISVDEYDGDFPSDTGHYLGYGLTNFIPNTGIYAWPDEPDAQDAIDEVSSQGGVGFIAHPNETVWDWNNFAVTGYTGIEVWNGEWNDADQYALELWDRLLSDGLTSGIHVVGTGNSDAHPRDRPFPLPDETYEPSVWTYLLLPSLTHAEVVDAYKEGHVVFTNGPFLTFKIGQQAIGDTVNVDEGSSVTLNFQWDSSGFGEMEEVTIRRITSSGSTDYPIPVSGTSGSDSWTDPAPVEGPCCYRLEGRSVEDHTWPIPDETFHVYTNPIWIRATNEITDAVLVNTTSLISSSTTGDSRAFHVFTSPVGFLIATEGNTFLIMSTGIAANIAGSPEHFESTDFSPGGTAGDTASFTLKFLVPDGATTLSFDFRFMSEEYPEWVGTQYNDFFYAYLTDSTGTHQVAFDDNGHIININNNFFNPNIYPIGTVFDGATKRLTTTVNVNEGEQITLRFVVGDVGDGIYDTAVFIDNVRFNVGGGPGTTPTADVIVVKNGPNSVEQGKQLAYTLNYFNIEEASAQNVVVTDTLPSEVSFISASSGGVYSSSTHSVSWNLGTLAPFSSGSLTLTVSIPSSTSIGTVLENTASISTTSQESNSQNNDYPKSTTVTGGASLPPNVEVGPTVSNHNGIPVLYWTTPITFTYHGDANVIGVDINIHLPDGGPDIGGPMINTPGTYDWTFTYTFYPRHGQGIVTYTVHYADGSQDTVGHNILVDPSGYVYNAITGERIEGATVTLFRFDFVLMQFVIVPPDDLGIDPHINPQITDENGGYGWMVSPGMYMVQVEKEGYATNFAIVTVPPPATDLNIALTPIDTTPPTTQIMIGAPHYIDSSGNSYVTSDTSFTLTPDDGLDGSGVEATYYRHYNLPYDSDWTGYSDPFYLEGLEDDTYSIDYYSTDLVGNVEPTNTIDVTLDNTAPEIIVSNPPAGWALQDGVTFLGSITDAGSGVSSMSFSIREQDGGTGTQIGYEDLPVSYDPATGQWSFSFDTLLVPDGYYVLHIEAEDNLGNEADATIPYSIRNWAVLELLPASENNKARRTMPVKFALRVKASVDPLQPFVYNEELRIEIYATDKPDEILQESTFGDTTRDYRISSVLYITNFKTLKKPMEYTVTVYRNTSLQEYFDIGSFTFETVK